MSALDSADLRSIAYDFHVAGQCLTQIIVRLEKVVSAADTSQNLEHLQTLYRVRDSAVANCRELNAILDRL